MTILTSTCTFHAEMMYSEHSISLWRGFSETKVRLLFLSLWGYICLVHNCFLQTVSVEGTVFWVFTVARSFILNFQVPTFLEDLLVMGCNMGGHIWHGAITNFDRAPVENLMQTMMWRKVLIQKLQKGPSDVRLNLQVKGNNIALFGFFVSFSAYMVGCRSVFL